MVVLVRDVKAHEDALQGADVFSPSAMCVEIGSNWFEFLKFCPVVTQYILYLVIWNTLQKE